MTLEFHCPSCNTHIQTPDSTAGKKGRCPSCSAIFDIPGGPAGPTTPGPLSSTAPQAPGGQATGEIQFNCPHCSGVVKTPPSSAGSKGKCPYCQAVVTIPISSQQAPPSGGGLTPLGGAGSASSGLTPMGSSSPPASSSLTPLGGGLTPLDNSNSAASNDPFSQLGGSQSAQGADPYAANPFSDQSAISNNPYASPATASGHRMGKADAQNRVRVPAIALISLSTLSVVLFLVYGIVQIATGAGNPPPQMNDAEAAGFRMGFICGTFAPVLINAICLAGSISMLRLRSYGASVTAAIMALIPCSAACFVGSIPFGIWALVVLMSADVRREFT